MIFKIFNFKKIIKSIRIALEGLKSAVLEQTFRIFCFIAVLVIILIFLFKVALWEKVILILTITFVMAIELINSRIEKVLDIFQPNHDHRVKAIKDASAGAVLLVCLGAAAIGILIFWPHFKNILF